MGPSSFCATLWNSLYVSCGARKQKNKTKQNKQTNIERGFDGKKKKKEREANRSELNTQVTVGILSLLLGLEGCLADGDDLLNQHQAVHE